MLSSRLILAILLFSLLFSGCQQKENIAEKEINEFQKEKDFENKARSLFNSYQEEKFETINDEENQLSRQEKNQELLSMARSYQADFELLQASEEYQGDLELIKEYFQKETDYYQTDIELEEIKKERQETNIMSSEEAKKMIELVEKSEERYNLLDRLQSEIPYIFAEQP